MVADLPLTDNFEGTATSDGNRYCILYVESTRRVQFKITPICCVVDGNGDEIASARGCAETAT